MEAKHTAMVMLSVMNLGRGGGGGAPKYIYIYIYISNLPNISLQDVGGLEAKIIIIIIILKHSNTMINKTLRHQHQMAILITQ